MWRSRANCILSAYFCCLRQHQLVYFETALADISACFVGQATQPGAKEQAEAEAAAASDQPAGGETDKAPPGGAAAGAGAAPSASGLFGAFGKRHYEGGFEEKMTRKEAALILGVRESAAANRIKVRDRLPCVFPACFSSTLWDGCGRRICVRSLTMQRKAVPVERIGDDVPPRRVLVRLYQGLVRLQPHEDLYA